MITSAVAHAAYGHTRARTCHGFQGSTASAGTRDRTVLFVKINDYIEGFAEESDAGPRAGGKVVIFTSSQVLSPCKQLFQDEPSRHGLPAFCHSEHRYREYSHITSLIVSQELIFASTRSEIRSTVSVTRFYDHYSCCPRDRLSVAEKRFLARHDSFSHRFAFRLGDFWLAPSRPEFLEFS